MAADLDREIFWLLAEYIPERCTYIHDKLVVCYMKKLILGFAKKIVKGCSTTFIGGSRSYSKLAISSVG